jgi:hypothetical protein
MTAVTGPTVLFTTFPTPPFEVPSYLPDFQSVEGKYAGRHFADWHLGALPICQLGFVVLTTPDSPPQAL